MEEEILHFPLPTPQGAKYTLSKDSRNLVKFRLTKKKKVAATVCLVFVITILLL